MTADGKNVFLKTLCLKLKKGTLGTRCVWYTTLRVSIGSAKITRSLFIINSIKQYSFLYHHSSWRDSKHNSWYNISLELPLTQPAFQRWINVVSTLWINVEITLNRRWKWNKIQPRIFNVVQRWYNVSIRRWNNIKTTLHNVETTLVQRCFNLVLTLVKAILNPIGLVMIGDCEIIEYIVNTWIVFLLLNEETFFYYILKI